jgi:hypothetical protein
VCAQPPRTTPTSPGNQRGEQHPPRFESGAWEASYKARASWDAARVSTGPNEGEAKTAALFPRRALNDLRHATKRACAIWSALSPSWCLQRSQYRDDAQKAQEQWARSSAGTRCLRSERRTPPRGRARRGGVASHGVVHNRHDRSTERCFFLTIGGNREAEASWASPFTACSEFEMRNCQDTQASGTFGTTAADARDAAGRHLRLLSDPLPVG